MSLSKLSQYIGMPSILSSLISSKEKKDVDFKVMKSNLDKIKESIFIYDDDLILGILAAVYSEGCNTLLEESVCFTALYGTKQYICARFGTLYIEDECSACDSVCQHNPEPLSVLTILDLSKDCRTRDSNLVSSGPKLRFYSGIRINDAISLIVLSTNICLISKKAQRWEKALKRAALIVFPLMQSFKDKEEIFDKDELVFVVDTQNIIVRVSPACAKFFLLSPSINNSDVEKKSTLIGLDASCLVKDNHLLANIRDEEFQCLNNIETWNNKRINLKAEHLRRVTRVRIHDVSCQVELEDKTKALEIQHKLMSQLAHELRNKYTASIDVMEEFMTKIETESTDDSLWNQLPNLRDAVSLLREGDLLIKTRLSLYKMQRGVYNTNENRKEPVEIYSHLVNALSAAGQSAYLENPDPQLSGESKNAAPKLNSTKSPNQIRRITTSQKDVVLRLRNEAKLPKKMKLILDTHIFDYVVSSLLSNALKFTSHGHIEFVIHDLESDYSCHDDNEKHLDSCSLVCGVRDTGQGIPESIRTSLFSNKVLTADERGSGLSLSACAAYLNVINGAIWLASSVRRKSFDSPFSDNASTDANTTIDENNQTYTDIRFRIPCFPIIESDEGYSSGDETQINDYYQKSGKATGTTSSSSNDSGSNEKASISSSLKEQCSLLQAHIPESTLTASNSRRDSYDSDFFKVSSKPSLIIRKIYIVEDSELMRKLIRNKLKATLNHVNDLDFFEYDTVEEFLDGNNNAVPSNDSLITIDHNLAAKGGLMVGSDLIKYLKDNNFNGTIVSISGDDAISTEHRLLGADFILGKPLPPVSTIRNILSTKAI
uniref:Response regulatory domain-containing protein n=1 Tax=Aureoumbra lagunensis TaxID=44058 RepID=A0A7S3K0P8_9STRA|mmetsp:Transcript_15631/g.19070  ORF Transcript_15631/g.19070 Transcript_15631/m.19070 type:complete len:829 (-) Transcript_15631:377-2863(-)